MHGRPLPKRGSAERRSPQSASASERDDLKVLPETMQMIAEATSLEIVEKLIGAYGGSVVFIPQQVRDGSALTNLIGAENVERIIKTLGCGHLHITTGTALQRRRRNRQIRAARATGMSIMKIAMSFKLHHRTVRRALNGDRGRA